jgi:ribonuclease HI
LADRLWDAATDPVRSDIPSRDDDDLLGRGGLRSPVLVEATRMLWTRSSLKGRVVIEDAEAAQSSAETCAPHKRTAIFTDASKLEDGWQGCAAVWQGPDGCWQGRHLFMGRNTEVFDDELYAIWVGLKAAKDSTDSWAAGPRAVTIFTDAQAPLKGIRNDDPGPGQWLVRRILRTERQLRQAGGTTEFRWIPGHKGIEGNEVADQWAKQAAGASGAEHLPAGEESITTLAHVARGITEAKWQQHLAWVKERCRGTYYYVLQERQRADPVAFSAKKAIASRFYQLRMCKAHTGPHLGTIGEAADDKCWWCGSGASQTREHLFKHCRQWKDQRITMWRAVRQATEGKRTARNTSMAQLFGDARCTAAILEFLETTEVGVRGQVARPIAGAEDDVSAEHGFVAEDE